MPLSWPQPAVLQNLLPSSTVVESTGTKDGNGKSTSAAPLYDHRVLALYKFVSPKLPKEGLPKLKKELETVCRQHSARGTLLIAEEGINGTICYPFQQPPSESTSTAATAETNCEDESVTDGKNDQENNGDELLSFLQAKFDGSLRIRISVAEKPVFARLKIKIKSEIVTMHWEGDQQCSIRKNDKEGNNHSNDENKDTISSSSAPASPSACGPCCPTERVGEYVQPRDWNKLLEDPDTLVIDTRNEYEIDVGTFRNAANPHTQSFVEFPDWIKRNLLDGNGSNESDSNSYATEKKALMEKKKIAMFCEFMVSISLDSYQFCQSGTLFSFSLSS